MPLSNILNMSSLTAGSPINYLIIIPDFLSYVYICVFKLLGLARVPRLWTPDPNNPSCLSLLRNWKSRHITSHQTLSFTFCLIALAIQYTAFLKLSWFFFVSFRLLRSPKTEISVFPSIGIQEKLHKEKKEKITTNSYLKRFKERLSV